MYQIARSFLLIHSFAFPLLLLLMVGPSRAAAERTVHLVVGAEVKPPVAHALGQLTGVLKQKGFTVVRQTTLPQKAARVFVVGIPGQLPVLDRLLATHGLAVPKPPESVLIEKLSDHSPSLILMAGRDDRGLMYALLEVARSIELAPEGVDPLEQIHEVSEAPLLEFRGVTIHLFNADLDGQWYYDEEFWRTYFTMLARSRLNTFALTFADHTAYMNPPYPFLVEVPEYPEVKAIGLSDAERERNLRMLKRISELATEHGVDFLFSTWMQGARLLGHLGPNMVEGLPEYPKDYAAKALSLILKSCPEIHGVQFRMNLESGIPEDKQADYYQALFEAMRDCGRSVRLDLRFKGLRPETIDAALDAGLDVNVSTKYWCEQIGLPYHPTVADKNYRQSRYGYGAMLFYPRRYQVTYRLWTVGTQKILLWGDPQFGSRFARSCLLGGGRGFEVFAPLTNKGYGNGAGIWRIFADRSYKHYRYEQQRYWMFYLAFGRTGYDADVPPYVWQREFRHRFGKAAPHVEAAYRSAGQILPLMTAAGRNSASEWRTWPEMEPGYILPAYARTVPSDTAQFYAIRSFARVPGWRAESWQSDIPGYVEDVIRGELKAKWTPPQVSRRLHELSGQTLSAIDQARRLVADPDAPEFKATELDMRVLAHIAVYHAEKILAATHVELFRETQQTGRLVKALEHINSATKAWETIVKLTDGVYYADMVFGREAPESLEPPFEVGEKIAHHLRGHWKDRLTQVRYDVAYVEELIKKHGGRAGSFRTFPGETALADPAVVKHQPITRAKPHEDLRIEVQVTSRTPLRRVLLHHRPLNNTVDWQAIEMNPRGEHGFEATIHGEAISPAWDYMYYIEALVEGGGGTLWPSWQEGPPYVVVELDHAAPKSDTRPRDPLGTVAGQKPTVVEAEDGYCTAVWGHAWELKSSLCGYSGDGYRCALPDRGTRVHGRPTRHAPSIEIPLKFGQPGRYRLWVRMQGPNTSGNSVFAGLDGRELSPSHIVHVLAGDGWNWVGDYEKGPPVLFDVSKAGTHVIHLWMREDGVAIDQVMVTSRLDLLPEKLSGTTR